MAHLTFGFIALAPLMAFPHFANKHKNTLTSHWKGIACVGAFKVGTIRTPTTDSCEVLDCLHHGSDVLDSTNTDRAQCVFALHAGGKHCCKQCQPGPHIPVA